MADGRIHPTNPKNANVRLMSRSKRQGPHQELVFPPEEPCEVVDERVRGGAIHEATEIHDELALHRLHRMHSGPEERLDDFGVEPPPAEGLLVLGPEGDGGSGHELERLVVGRHRAHGQDAVEVDDGAAERALRETAEVPGEGVHPEHELGAHGRAHVALLHLGHVVRVGVLPGVPLLGPEVGVDVGLVGIHAVLPQVFFGADGGRDRMNGRDGGLSQVVHRVEQHWLGRR